MTSGPSDQLAVVHVCCTDSFAGVERHVSELARVQASSGADVVIIGGDRDLVAAAAGDRVKVLPGRRINEAVRSLRRLPFRPDVINAHMTAAELAAVAGRPEWRVPVVSTRHFASHRGARRLTRPVTRLAHRSIAAQLAVSQYVADHVDGTSTVVLSGVRPVDGRVPAKGRQPVVLLAQRLESEKQSDLALHAFARSGLLAEGWRLLVAGDGTLRSSLEELSRSLGIDAAVEFLGHRNDVHQLMESAAMFLATRPDEAFGLSVVEAMARGLPVVAAGSGAHLETVGAVNGAALFPAGDVGDAARLLKEQAASPEQRDRYGARLQEVQRERFTVELQARHTDRVYRGVL